MVDVINDMDCPKAGKHRKLETAEVKKSDDAVQRILSVVRNFTNPFTISDKDKLYSLASGASGPINIEMDILRAQKRPLKLIS